MKKLTRDRVVPIISASVSWLTFAMIGSGRPSLPKFARSVAPTPRLTLTAEQEYIIRDIILKNSNVQKQNTPPETVGDVVPEHVKLYPLPQDVIQKVPQARSHMFFVKDDEVILVSSSDRRVADVIKKKSTD